MVSLDRCQIVQRYNLYAQLHQSGLNFGLLHRVVGPVRHVGHGGNIGHVQPIAPQFFGQYPAHVIVIIVENDHRTVGNRSRHNLVRGQDSAAFGRRDRNVIVTPDTVTGPGRPGGNDHMVGTEFGHVFGGEMAVKKELNVRHLTDLVVAIIDHAFPLRKARQPAFNRAPTTNLFARLSQRDHVAAPGQRAGGL